MGITTVLYLQVDCQFTPLSGCCCIRVEISMQSFLSGCLLSIQRAVMYGRMSSFSGPSCVYLQVDGGQIVPGVSIVWLLLCTAAEGLQRPLKVLLLQRAVSQRKPPLRVQRIHPQSQLPMLCCLCEREFGSTGWEPGSGCHFTPGGFSMQ